MDVKIADRHVLEIREGGFFVSVGSTVVVGWWSLVFNGTRNAPVRTRSVLGVLGVGELGLFRERSMIKRGSMRLSVFSNEAQNYCTGTGYPGITVII